MDLTSRPESLQYSLEQHARIQRPFISNRTSPKDRRGQILPRVLLYAMARRLPVKVAVDLLAASILRLDSLHADLYSV